jgi:hypothetical protein
MGANSKTARVAGLLYLVIIVAGIFAFAFVRDSLVVPGDATVTADNITASEPLFRVGIASDLVMIISDVALALVLYALLKPVSNSLALLAAFFRLTQAAILGINLLNLFFALAFAKGADYLTALGSDRLDALALQFVDAHAIGYAIGLVFFGVSLFIVGYLVFKSGYLPRVLGILLIVASLVYLVDSFANTLMPNYEEYADLFGSVVFGVALFVELAFALWLLLKGVKEQQRESRISLDTPQTEGLAT